MLSSYCDVFAQCQQLTGQTVLTSSVSLTAAGSEIWVFFAALHSVFAAASVRESFCAGAGGDHEQAMFCEHGSLSVHVMLHASLFSFSELLISVFFHYRGQD